MTRKKQWHPLFARLLRLFVDAHYVVDPEVPVSDLPRRADLMLVRRIGTSLPPFMGLWSRLTPYNVMEFKGPTDDPEEIDLDLLMHVGTGITCRLNEERKEQKLPRLANREVSLWYLVPKLGDAALLAARLRTSVDYQTGGVWTARAWGHHLFLVSYRDLPIEPDSVPLHLLRREPDSPPRELAELVARSVDLTRSYAPWMQMLHPSLYKEMRTMPYLNEEGKLVFNWKAIVEAYGAEEVIRMMGVEAVVSILPVKEAIQAMDPKEVIGALDYKQIAQAMGQERLISALLSGLSPDAREELRRQLQAEDKPPTG